MHFEQCQAISKSTGKQCGNKTAFKKGCQTKCHKHSDYHEYGHCDENFLEKTKVAMQKASDKIKDNHSEYVWFQKQLRYEIPEILDFEG